MSMLGGAIGLLCGWAGSVMVARVLQWPTTLPVWAVVSAVLCSGGVGIFFGYYPARKASLLDPIEALRYE
jgi:ABC-type antimicrobial peptide transport system permease subunit